MTKLPNSLTISLAWATLAVNVWGQAPEDSIGVSNFLQITAVSVDGKPAPWRPGHALSLGSSPANVLIAYGPAKNIRWAPIRLRFRLEGYDTAWRRAESEMVLSIRFYNELHEIVDKISFSATRDSAGWNGTWNSSPFVHRRETIVVPPHVSRLMAVISSAGAPTVVGIFVVDDLTVSRIASTNGLPQLMLRTPSDVDPNDNEPETKPADRRLRDWVRDGTRPRMAKIFELGRDPARSALGILDDDPVGHAEWHNRIEVAPQVASGEALVVEWNELFSVGGGDTRPASYQSLPPGSFRFCVQEQTALGVPTGVELSLPIRVSVPLWKQSWLRATVATILAAASIAGTRYRASYKLRREVQRLKHQEELEQERLRIARDLHDDLGSLLTEISLLSDRALGRLGEPGQTGGHLRTISQKTRSAVEALDRIVWAINPENDTLDHLADSLLQYAEAFFRSTPIRCRFDVPEDVPDDRLGAQARHHAFLALKEACNNVARHSGASEVWIRLRPDIAGFSIAIEDNGRGFIVGVGMDGSDGLRNMRTRVAEIGGRLDVCSEPGRGTSVQLLVPLGETRFSPCPSG